MNTMANQHPEPSDHEGGGHHQDGPVIVLFVFMGLLFGCILRQINKKTRIPYTPMLLVLGIFFGYARESLGVFGQSVTLISNMSPHMILFVFIPVLLFESAFNCDWHVFRKSLVNILLLAGPGVLWGAFIIAFIFKAMLGYGEEDLTWFQALTLGCVLSATDPVAVVALLKELGASVHFNLLVEGESLLNDGTAMVFFMLFISLVKGEEATALGVVTNFVRVSIGGPLLGIFVGFLVCLWMKKILRDTVLSVTITFLGAYICFYIAEFTWVKVSGILSLVSLGLFFSAVGKRKIYPQSQHALHYVWSTIQYGAQTLVFMLTGIIVGIRMIDETTITAGDWFKMFFFYILMLLSRTLMILTFYPLLKRFGYGLTRKQFVVLIYGGLRGALGMCLSLFVGVDGSLRLRFRQITVFYMCGMACLTIVLNGLTCGKVVKFVQMIHVPPIKGKLLKRSLRAVLESTQLKLKEVKMDSSFSYAKWRSVEKDANVKEIGGTFHERISRATQVQNNPLEIQLRDSLKEINRDDIKEEIRFRYTSILSRVIWHHYEEGQLSEEGVALLTSACSITNDEPRMKLNYFQILCSFYELDSIDWYLKWKATPFIGDYMARTAIQRLYNIFETTTVFIEACEMVKPKLLKEYPFIEEQHLRYIFEEVEENIEHAQTYISQLEGTYPKIIQAVHTERATTVLLKNKKNALKDLFDQGCMDEVDYAALRKEVDKKLLQIRHSNVSLEDIRFNEVFAHCPLFSVLNQHQLGQLRSKSKMKDLKKGAVIIKRGSNIKSAIVIVSGSVKEAFKDGDDKFDFHLIRSVGCVLDAYDFTYKEEAKCEVKARNNLKIYQIEEAAINELINTNFEFKKLWFKSLFIYCYHLHEGLREIKGDVCDRDVRKIAQYSEVVSLGNSQTFQVEEGAFIFMGQVECDRLTYVKGNYITKPSIIKSLTPNTVFLNFASNKKQTNIHHIRDSDQL